MSSESISYLLYLPINTALRGSHDEVAYSCVNINESKEIDEGNTEKYNRSTMYNLQYARRISYSKEPMITLPLII